MRPHQQGILKKVLAGPIVVTPAESTPTTDPLGRLVAKSIDEAPEAGWTFYGYTFVAPRRSRGAPLSRSAVDAQLR